MALALPAALLMGCSSPSGIAVNKRQTVVMDPSVLTAGILADTPSISNASGRVMATSVLNNSQSTPVTVHYRFYWYDAQGLDIRPFEKPRGSSWRPNRTPKSTRLTATWTPKARVCICTCKRLPGLEKSMKKYVLVALAALTLSGCLSRPPEPDQPLPPVTVEPDQPNPPVEQPQPPTSEPVPQPPKIQQLDWLGSVQPLVGQMLKADGVTAGSVLLLDSVKNNTNGSLQMGKATAALYKALASNSTFSVVPEAKLTSARQTLGLSADDSFGSRSKAIGLARIVGAQYVLYSDVSGDVKSPALDMQLMLVQTGEIVWSGNGAVKR